VVSVVYNGNVKVINTYGVVMYIVDMHCDSLLKVNADTGLVNPHNISAKYPQLQLFANFVPKDGMPLEHRRKKTFSTVDVYIAECQRLGLFPVRDCQELNYAVGHGLNASMLSIEGGAGLMPDSPELDTLYRMGLRVMGLCWDSNELATAAWDSNDCGLSEYGKRMVDVLSSYGIIIDVSHLSDRSFYDVIERTAYPVIATHSNFRDVCFHPRNLTLDMARRIAMRGGVIGLNIYPKFLSDSGRADKDDIYRHVDYALEHLGEDVLVFGCDIDGIEAYPCGFNGSESIHDTLVDILLERYSAGVVEKIAGLNAINFFKGNL
jgi:membrane dipeptidase